MAYAIILGGLPRFLEPGLDLLRGGIELRGHPARVGIRVHPRQLGVVTTFLRETFGFNIYDTGFKLSDKLGLSSSTCTSRSR